MTAHTADILNVAVASANESYEVAGQSADDGMLDPLHRLRGPHEGMSAVAHVFHQPAAFTNRPNAMAEDAAPITRSFNERRTGHKRIVAVGYK